MIDTGDADRRAELMTRRERVVDLYVSGHLTDRQERDRRLERINLELAELGAAERVAARPTIDWDADPKAINAAVRDVLIDVVLGPDLLPVEARWRRPEWRAEPPA